jgi:hypothetical protein
MYYGILLFTGSPRVVELPAIKANLSRYSDESLEDCHYKAAKDVLTLYYNSIPNQIF